MIVRNILLVMANTARSQGYAQALKRAGYKFIQSIIINKLSGVALGQINRSEMIAQQDDAVDGLFYPDFSIPLDTTVAEITEHHVLINSGSVNDETVINILKSKDFDLVIYSGFGGEIVSSKVLDAGPRLLHIHSGYLPEYRGSTTIYYSLLEEKRCGVSAILLKDQIDTGEIVKRIWYKAPPAGIDIDYSYDVAIRADTLVRVLDEWSVNCSFPYSEEQMPGDGDVYYVIHPVLKHLAMMGLDTSGQ